MHEILCLDKEKNTVNQVEITSIPELLTSENNVLWINLQNPPNIWPEKEEMNLLSNVLNIHKLSIEDCITEMHHPKIEEFSNYLLLVIYGFKRENKLKFRDLELILGKNYVVSYSYEKIDEIEAVKNNFISCSNSSLASPLGLFYAIIDNLIDNYLPIIDNFDIQIGKIEENLFKDPSNTKCLKQLNNVRACMNTTRHIIVLENEIFYNIVKKHYSKISDDKLVYFRDVYDHLEKNLAKIDSLKESISNLLGIQMNINAQNLNEIMKFLTVISTILLPANLITAFFGMNFDNIPFIHTSYGLSITIISMILFGVVMGFYFKRKKWI